MKKFENELDDMQKRLSEMADLARSVVVLTADAVLQAYKGTYHITNLDGEPSPEYPMTASILWIRHEGEWKIVHHHQSWSTDAG